MSLFLKEIIQKSSSQNQTNVKTFIKELILPVVWIPIERLYIAAQ